MASLDDLDDDDAPTKTNNAKSSSLDDLDDDDKGGSDGDDGEGDEDEDLAPDAVDEGWEDDPSRVYMICPPPADWKIGTAPIVIASVAKPIAHAKIEQCGFEYHRRVMGIAANAELKLKDQRATSSASGSGGSADDKSNEKSNEKKAEEEEFVVTKAHRAFLEDTDNELTDFYGLLGVTPDQVELDDSVVSRAFRTLSKLMHPDKATPAKREFAEERFKALQKAQSTLSDANRRHTYFSSLEFDDTVPGEKQGTGESFYKVYGPVFQRNSAFSSVRPVPQLGDANTSYDDVNAYVLPVSRGCAAACLSVCLIPMTLLSGAN